MHSETERKFDEDDIFNVLLIEEYVRVGVLIGVLGDENNIFLEADKYLLMSLPVKDSVRAKDSMNSTKANFIWMDIR